jgi:hypothetical protein
MDGPIYRNISFPAPIARMIVALEALEELKANKGINHDL